MTLNGITFTRTKDTPNGPWHWRTNPTSAEILAGATSRRATAAEARQLNHMVANDFSAMTSPGVHPSYRVS